MESLNIINLLFDKVQEEMKNLKNVNILVVGKTGVGKSTLVNSIFRDNIAETGIGKPVTQVLKKITREGVPITLYDTKGLELSAMAQADVKKEILDEIEICANKRNNSNDDSDLMHVCWYCIDATIERIEDVDKEWINDISKKVSVVVVVTKGWHKKDAARFRAEVEGLNLECTNIITVLAEKVEDEDDTGKIRAVKSYGLDTLVKHTMQLLPEGVRHSFNNAQKVSIDEKVSKASGLVMKYVVGATTIGLSPVPGSDAPLLISEQIAMIAHITSIFGIPVDKAFLYGIIAAAGGTSGATIGGKTLVSNALKCFPGAGTIVGGLISAGAAGMITYGLGMAYVNVLKYVCIKQIEGKEVSKEEIIDKMKEELRSWSNIAAK